MTNHYHLVVRYVVLNPVRAGLCGLPTDWPWSSYRALAGLEPAPTFLADQFVLSLFDDTYERARAWCRSFIADGLDVASTPRDVPWCLTPG